MSIKISKLGKINAKFNTMISLSREEIMQVPGGESYINSKECNLLRSDKKHSKQDAISSITKNSNK
ncbi:hypothetical protein W03_13030 [Nitrosomonas sp. PY1]|uniref:hypothetical protein n=1 Tax=Nitrosomonas sp. PY1 TaxID=1803906 RepID=UPI001FC7FAF1|nr:hypothetical protein [Nitrosomonas sp. PY1]GKS69299.1 hypothetical protein W03_13030 [Nitrosomonas sp. PY1]